MTQLMKCGDCGQTLQPRLQDGVLVIAHRCNEAEGEGWKLVPTEPNYRMVHAGRKAMVRPTGVIETLDLTVIWKAMLDATPSPDVSEERKP